jgi:hypothetical protein
MALQTWKNSRFAVPMPLANYSYWESTFITSRYGFLIVQVSVTFRYLVKSSTSESIVSLIQP